MSNDDKDFRRGVERDARRAGMPDDLAALVAREVGKPHGADPMAERLAKLCGATAARPAPPRLALKAWPEAKTRNERIAALCRLYGAPDALSRELQGCTAALRTVSRWLADATGSAAKMTPGGVGSVRVQMTAHAINRGEAA